MQVAFASASSPWNIPLFEGARLRAEQLVEEFPGKVIFTRFVPPEKPSGSWEKYYSRWAFAMQVPSDLWELVQPWRDRTSIALPTFSKWGPELKAELDLGADLLLCGVATDCCVLATALGAVDDGINVRIVGDACGAATPEQHAEALRVLERRIPQLVVTDVAAELSIAKRQAWGVTNVPCRLS